MAEGQDTLSISQAKDEKTKAWTSAGSQSATSKGARFEDDVDSRGKNGRTERKWVTSDGPELWPTSPEACPTSGLSGCE